VVEFDEPYYLSRYPDVATGIRQGHIGSARDHFDGPGYSEGRQPFPPNR